MSNPNHNIGPAQPSYGGQQYFQGQPYTQGQQFFPGQQIPQQQQQYFQNTQFPQQPYFQNPQFQQQNTQFQQQPYFQNPQFPQGQQNFGNQTMVNPYMYQSNPQNVGKSLDMTQTHAIPPSNAGGGFPSLAGTTFPLGGTTAFPPFFQNPYPFQNPSPFQNPFPFFNPPNLMSTLSPLYGTGQQLYNPQFATVFGYVDNSQPQIPLPAPAPGQDLQHPQNLAEARAGGQKGDKISLWKNGIEYHLVVLNGRHVSVPGLSVEVEQDTFKDETRDELQFQKGQATFDFDKLCLTFKSFKLQNSYEVKNENGKEIHFRSFQRFIVRIGGDFAFQNGYQEMILQPKTAKQAGRTETFDVPATIPLKKK